MDRINIHVWHTMQPSSALFLNALRKQLNWAAPELSDWLQRLLVPSRACWNTRVKWPGSRTILFSWDCVELYWVLIQVPAGFCGRRRLAGRYSDDKDKEQLLMLSSATRLICRDSVLKKIRHKQVWLRLTLREKWRDLDATCKGGRQPDCSESC